MNFIGRGGLQFTGVQTGSESAGVGVVAHCDMNFKYGDVRRVWRRVFYVEPNPIIIPSPLCRYSSTPVFTDNTFQDPSQLRETADNT
jgi:hypothetical protein